MLASSFFEDLEMYMIIKSDELLHYGIRGMRWGVRKDGGSSGGSKLKKAAKIVSPLGYAAVKGAKKATTVVSNNKRVRSAQNKYRNLTGSRGSAATKKYRNKNIDGMSDADLRKAVNRMNLERQYRDLTRVDYMKGQKYASDILKYSGTIKRF